MTDMKILDIDTKGNLLRCYLGDATMTDWWGDDWDDAPYEYNAGPVYDQFVRQVADVVLDWDVQAVEPCGAANIQWCRNDFKARRVPLFLLSYPSDGWRGYWDTLIADPKTPRVFMGDPLEALTSLKGVTRLDVHTVGVEPASQGMASDAQGAAHRQ